MQVPIILDLFIILNYLLTNNSPATLMNAIEPMKNVDPHTIGKLSGLIDDFIHFLRNPSLVGPSGVVK